MTRAAWLKKSGRCGSAAFSNRPGRRSGHSTIATLPSCLVRKTEAIMNARTQRFSRRAVLSGLGASVAAPAFAAAPMANVQVPAVYRFKLGGFECTVVSDGPLGLGPIKAEMFKGYTQERIDELLAANFIDMNHFQLDQIVLVVNTGEKLVLIDTGMGARKMFGPTTGRLLANLQAAGINPASIDAVA